MAPEEPARAEALAAAQRALARRDLSERELRDRLQRAGLDPAAAEEVMEQLRRGGLVDDARFAEERARVLAERGKGDAAIRFAYVGSIACSASMKAQIPPRRCASAITW